MMEMTKQQYREMQAKNTAFMTVVGLRCLMDVAMFDLGYGNPANWRVLYHNTLDAYLQMPGRPSADVVTGMADVLTHASGQFVKQLVGGDADSSTIVLNVNTTASTPEDVQKLAAELLEQLKATVGDTAIRVDALNVFGMPWAKEEGA